MVLFLLIPVFVGAAVLYSAHKRQRRAYMMNGYVGQPYWQGSIAGSTPRASAGTLQVTLGNFFGPLLSVSKHGGRKVYVPEAYFVTAMLNGAMHRLTTTQRTSPDSLELSWGAGSELLFPIQQDAFGQPTSGNLVLNLYGCRKGSITGRTKKIVLLGHARLSLAQCLDGESRALTAQFCAPEEAERRHRKRSVVAPSGSDVGQMGVGVKLVTSRGYAPLAAQTSAQYAYDPLKLNEKGGVSAEGYVSAAVYGPDGAAWVVETKEEEALHGTDNEKTRL